MPQRLRGRAPARRTSPAAGLARARLRLPPAAQRCCVLPAAPTLHCPRRPVAPGPGLAHSRYLTRSAGITYFHPIVHTSVCANPARHPWRSLAIGRTSIGQRRQCTAQAAASLLNDRCRSTGSRYLDQPPQPQPGHTEGIVTYAAMRLPRLLGAGSESDRPRKGPGVSYSRGSRGDGQRPAG